MKTQTIIRFFLPNLLLIFILNSAPLAQDIKIGTDCWPPHEDIFNKEAPGFCTEVAEKVFEKMNLTISITQYPWARAVDLVFKGKNDALFCALYSEKRAKFCYYPEESVASLKYLLFISSTNKGKLKFDSFDDLIGKKIGLVRAFAYPKEFWDFVKEQKNYEEVESDDLNFKKLMAGRIDYAIADQANGALLIKKHGLSGKVIPLLSKVVHESELYIIFSKKTRDPQFVKKFSRALGEFKKTEEYRALYEKYYGIQ